MISPRLTGDGDSGNFLAASEKRGFEKLKYRRGFQAIIAPEAAPIGDLRTTGGENERRLWQRVPVDQNL